MKLLSRRSDKVFSLKFGTRRETGITLSTALNGKMILKRLPLYKCTCVQALRLCTGRTAPRGAVIHVHPCTGTEALYRSYGP